MAGWKQEVIARQGRALHPTEARALADAQARLQQPEVPPPAVPPRAAQSVERSKQLIANVAKMPPQAQAHPQVQADLAQAQRVVAQDTAARRPQPDQTSLPDAAPQRHTDLQAPPQVLNPAGERSAAAGALSSPVETAPNADSGAQETPSTSTSTHGGSTPNRVASESLSLNADAANIPATGENGPHSASSLADQSNLPDHASKTVAGTGSFPTVRWKPNPVGTPVRTIDQAITIAREHGIEIPQWVKFRAVPAEFYGVDTWAKYANFFGTGNKRITWGDFCNDGSNVSIGLDERLLNSDEGIVGIIVHEMHELEALRKMLHEAGSGMSLDPLAALIQGPYGILHQQAWDVSDEKITNMRKAGDERNVRQF